MVKIKKTAIAAIILMTLFSLSSIINLMFGVNLTGLTIIIGIISFFITLKSDKENGYGDSLEFKNIPNAFKDKTIWMLIFMPTLMNIVCNILAWLLVPEFTEHLKARTEMLAFDKIPLLLLEFAVAALGEEIAWRGFFQKQLSKAFTFVPALIISSVLFSVCHISQGSVIVVTYDILFIIINALFYGIIFRKTNNAWVSAIAHFLANTFAAFMLLML